MEIFWLLKTSVWCCISYCQKKELSTKKKKKNTRSTRRLKLTAYISTNFKGRQEEVPLLGKYLDLARCEPLHLKNHTVKEMFIKYWKLFYLKQIYISKEIILIKEIPTSNIFFRFVDFVKTEMNSNFLEKK